MPFGETEMARIEYAYRPLYTDRSLFGPAWDSDYNRMLELCRRYEGFVPVYVPVLKDIPNTHPRRTMVVYYLIEWDFNHDEIATIYKYRAPRRHTPIDPREDDLQDFKHGLREYLTWKELPATMVEDVKSEIRKRRREELQIT